MTSPFVEKALNRMKNIQNHVKPANDLEREFSKFTFDMDKVKAVVRTLRPDVLFKVQEAVEVYFKKNKLTNHILPKDEYRDETNKYFLSVVKYLLKNKYITAEEIMESPEQFGRALMGVGSANCSTTTKLCVQYFLYVKTIKNLGTEKHHEFLRRGAVCDDIGCFAMTELGHGSNVQSVETTAHYDHYTKTFVLNSPTDTSIKFWIGNLGKTASYAVTFAQLYVGEKCHGVHCFLVPVRDTSTHEAYEGCLIGDCGDKMGLQGIDNGWIKFTNYRIDKNMLLNRFGDITDDGEYISSIQSANKRFAFLMAALSGGRVIASSNA